MRGITYLRDVVSEELPKFDIGGQRGCSRDDRASPIVQGLLFRWLARLGTAHLEFESSYLMVMVNRPSLVYEVRMMDSLK